MVKVFRCPNGDDTTRDSPTYGRTFQNSYAMDPRLGGLKLSGGGPLVAAREHMGLPSCSGPPAHWDPWPAGTEVARQRHAPGRHTGMTNVLSRHASVSTEKP